MKTLSASFLRQNTIRLTLSTPVQASLYVSLCAVTIWTIFFSTYPPAHNLTHSLRHHTLNVSCH